MPIPANLRAAVLEQLASLEIDEAVVWAVSSWGAGAIDVLRDVLRGRVPAGRYERANAAYLLGVIKPAKAIDDLTHALQNDPSGSVRTSAVAAYGRLGDAGARKALLTVAGAQAASWPERSTALTWLSAIGEAADLEVLERIKPTAGDVVLERLLADTVSALRHRTGLPPVVATPPQDEGGPQPGKPPTNTTKPTVQGPTTKPVSKPKPTKPAPKPKPTKPAPKPKPTKPAPKPKAPGPTTKTTARPVSRPKPKLKTPETKKPKK